MDRSKGPNSQRVARNKILHFWRNLYRFENPWLVGIVTFLKCAASESV